MYIVFSWTRVYTIPFEKELGMHDHSVSDFNIYYPPLRGGFTMESHYHLMFMGGVSIDCNGRSVFSVEKSMSVSVSKNISMADTDLIERDNFDNISYNPITINLQLHNKYNEDVFSSIVEKCNYNDACISQCAVSSMTECGVGASGSTNIQKYKNAGYIY
eukprot:Pgem_evm1s18157